MSDDFSPIEPPCVTGCGQIASPRSEFCTRCARSLEAEQDVQRRTTDEREDALWYFGQSPSYRWSPIWRDFPPADINAFAADERAAQRRRSD